MTEVEFGLQMDRLSKTYGAKSYPPEAVKLIWKDVSLISQPAFQNIVDQLIASFRQRPLVEDVRKLVWKERRKQTPAAVENVEDWRPEKYFCTWCKDNGVYICQKKGLSGDWAFRCHCDLGSRNSRSALPQYKQDHVKMGFFYSDIKTRQEGKTNE